MPDDIPDGHYALPGGLTLECSLVDEGEPTAFYYAEVEFASEAEAKAFTPPAWMGRMVTRFLAIRTAWTAQTTRGPRPRGGAIW